MGDDGNIYISMGVYGLKWANGCEICASYIEQNFQTGPVYPGKREGWSCRMDLLKFAKIKAATHRRTGNFERAARLLEAVEYIERRDFQSG
jgi:hypothetical protein